MFLIVRVLLITFAFALPLFASADVLINEIAWMGTENSANDEWIELYNDGESVVDLTGWTLNATDGTPSINLEGSIASQSFFLLERTDDTSVPSVTADQIYTGALSNSGEILVLSDSGGSEQDRVAGGENWESIGGDNSTKKTPQRTSSGWVTADPTPRATNATSDSTDDDNDSSDGGTTSSGGTTKKTVVKKSVFIKQGSEKRVIVGADTLFEGDAVDDKGEPLRYARYIWNLGDGSVKEGKEVTYAYRIPGEYTLVLTVQTGYETQTHKMKVVAEPANISISNVGYGKNGFVELYNKSISDLDLSGWILKIEESTFTFPKNTVVAAKGKVPFPSKITRLSANPGDLIALQYPNKKTVNVYTGPEPVQVQPIPPPPPVQTSVIDTSGAADVLEEKKIDESNMGGEFDIATGNIAAAASGVETDGKDSGVLVWLAALLGVILVAVAGVTFFRRDDRTEVQKVADKIKIVE